MHILDLYKKLLFKHRFMMAAFGITYIIVLGTYFYIRQRQAMIYELKHEARYEMRELSEQNDKLKRIIDSLSSARDQPRFIKSITFSENWDTEDKKKEVQRILEYAKFASSKDDVQRATALYQEALTVQKTFSAKYELGKLGYLAGDLDSCIQHWSAIVKEDTKGLYPAVRFYLAIALHEQGQDKQSRDNLREFISLAELRTKN